MSQFVINYQDCDDIIHYAAIRGESAEELTASFFTVLRDAVDRRASTFQFQGHELLVSCFSTRYAPGYFMYTSAAKNVANNNPHFVALKDSGVIFRLEVDITSLDEWFSNHEA